MEKKRWLTGRKVAGVVFILFMIDVSCFGAWWAITHPPPKVALAEGVRIGVAVDMTHYSGQNMYRGAELAVDEINAEGGILVGKERLDAVFVYEDTQEQSPDVGTEKTVAAVTKLLTTYEVNVVIGGYGEPLTALEICARYKTIYICPGNSEDAIPANVLANYDKYKYVFQTVPNSTMLGMWLVDFYTWLRDTYGFTKVAIISEEYTWCDKILKQVEKHFPDLGIDIVYKVRFPSTTTSFLPYITKAVEAGAQVIMPTIALDWGITFIKEWKSMRYGLSVGLVVSSERGTYWEETDGECKYHVELQTGIPKPNITETAFSFFSSFEEKYGELPMYVGEFAYSAVWAYKEAVERAGTLESDAVVAELEKTRWITPYSILEFNRGTHSAKFDVWPAQLSQWMGSEYRPTVWCNMESFTSNNFTCQSIPMADITLPTEEYDDWEIPGEWHYPP